MIRQQFEEALMTRYMLIGLPLETTIAGVMEEFSPIPPKSKHPLMIVTVPTV
jgi:hypothetical protein